MGIASQQNYYSQQNTCIPVERGPAHRLEASPLRGVPSMGHCQLAELLSAVTANQCTQSHRMARRAPGESGSRQLMPWEPAGRNAWRYRVIACSPSLLFALT
jgi:hypothetical protein